MQQTQIPYKTLRTFEGKQYIELSEHEEIVNGLTKFDEALVQLKGALSSIQGKTKEVNDKLKAIKL